MCAIKRPTNLGINVTEAFTVQTDWRHPVFILDMSLKVLFTANRLESSLFLGPSRLIQTAPIERVL